jgi:hypothetical protein
VQHALGYCDGLVAHLPGPIDINRHAFANDPLVHALFATADDIDQMLGRSQAMRDFLWRALQLGQRPLLRHVRRPPPAEEAARHGPARRCDSQRRTATGAYFSGQTLIEPSCQLENTLHGLRCKALESLLHTFHSHVERCAMNAMACAPMPSSNAPTCGAARHDGQPGLQGHAAPGRTVEKLQQNAEALMPEHLIMRWPSTCNRRNRPCT